jgi:hypothetical protein
VAYLVHGPVRASIASFYVSTSTVHIKDVEVTNIIPTLAAHVGPDVSGNYTTIMSGLASDAMLWGSKAGEPSEPKSNIAVQHRLQFTTAFFYAAVAYVVEHICVPVARSEQFPWRSLRGVVRPTQAGVQR